MRVKTGRVVRVDRGRDRVVVQGVNLVTRNQKPNQITEGGRFSKEAALHVSNVRLYSEADERGFRVGYRYQGSDQQLYGTRQAALATFDDVAARVKKIRVFLKKGDEVSVVPDPKKGDEA